MLICCHQVVNLTIFIQLTLFLVNNQCTNASLRLSIKHGATRPTVVDQFSQVRIFYVRTLLQSKSASSAPDHVQISSTEVENLVPDGNCSVTFQCCGWRSKACSRGLVRTLQKYRGLFGICSWHNNITTSCRTKDHSIGVHYIIIMHLPFTPKCCLHSAKAVSRSPTVHGRGSLQAVYVIEAYYITGLFCRSIQLPTKKLVTCQTSTMPCDVFFPTLLPYQIFFWAKHKHSRFYTVSQKKQDT